MFTGIIHNTGKLSTVMIKKGIKTLSIKTDLPLENIKIGCSIAVDGTCLTIHTIKKNEFTVDVMAETLDRTIISLYRKNSMVNLELPLSLGDKLDGHIITGHVDFVANILSVEETKSARIMKISLPSKFKKYIPEKGSVTINGVSLTIAKVQEKSFFVHIIPLTQQKTNLVKLVKENKVNVEIDIIARYLETLIRK